MFKNTLMLLAAVCSLQAFAQEVVGNVPMNLKKDRDVFQIVDQDAKKITLFVSDKNDVKALKLNDDMKIIDSISTTRPEKKYANMIGYNHSDSGYRLFWASNDREEIFTQSYDFGKHTTVSASFSLPYKGERLIQEFSANGKFYILTVLKNSNTVKLYTFQPDGSKDEKTLDLTGFRFYTVAYERTTFSDFFGNGQAPMVKITPESPTSLVTSSAKSKLYTSGNKAIMTFDRNFDYTQMVVLDLENFTASEKFIKKPYMSFVDRYDLNSASFLIDDKLFQVKISSEKMILTIKDLEDKLLKEYMTLGNATMDFKNTDIIQENDGSKHTRILDNTSQFVRKINNMNLGVSAYKLDGNYLVTIGCVSDLQPSTSAIIMGGVIGGAAGSLIAAAISNPTMDNFNAYDNRKIVYINCLFDSNAKHVKGEVKPLAFDKIKVFLETNKTRTSETLFKFDGGYFLGAYHTDNKKYLLRKFNE
jgi:hypothetical protein